MIITGGNFFGFFGRPIAAVLGVATLIIWGFAMSVHCGGGSGAGAYGSRECRLRRYTQPVSASLIGASLKAGAWRWRVR